jgi:SAM-dependent methyltransferase
MHWKVKAVIQNAVSLLPAPASYATYYWLQRSFGKLRRLDPTRKMSEGIELWKRALDVGYDPSDQVFFEIGTGRVPLVPISYWLMGARKTITVDLNPYMKAELIEGCIQYISEHQARIRELYGPLLDERRFSALLSLASSAGCSVSKVLDLCGIEYRAPCDAAQTGLDPAAVDIHASHMVLEHIPPETLRRILEEGNRITRRDGLFIHRVDYSDHFSHGNKDLTAINFLQYSDAEWKRYAGNRYMYMNRLRHDDFLELFQAVGHQLLEAQPDVDRRSQELLANGVIRLDERFRSKPREVLAIRAAWLISKNEGLKG